MLLGLYYFITFLIVPIQPPGCNIVINVSYILNVGDHWTCLTNIFSNNLNEVFVYNSRLSEFLITQLYCQRHFSGDMTTTVRRIHSVYGNFSSKRNKQDYAVTMQQLQQLHAATSSLLVSHLTKSFYSKKYMTE